jgi:hypothetical protein
MKNVKNVPEVAKVENFDVEKNAIGVKQHDKKEVKESLPSRASVLDAIINEGGSWEELIAKADAACAPLKTKIKKYSPSLIHTHMRYRLATKPHAFDRVKVTEAGIEVKK